MNIEELSANQFIRIVDVSFIKQGDYLWEDGDIVQIKEVELSEDRIDVWDKDKYLSELIYVKEFRGIEIVDISQVTGNPGAESAKGN